MGKTIKDQLGRVRETGEGHPAPVVILVRPQLGENIGATCRCMLNFGLTELRLVAPRDGWPNNQPSESATANAVGAFEHMKDVQVFENTADALKEFHTIYATTARPRDMRKPVMTARDAAQDIVDKQSQNLRTAILFGGERAGLTNEDIALSSNIITIPTNPDFSSLNLAQGVLLVANEVFQATHDAPATFTPTGDSAPVTHAELNEMISRLETELDNHKFFRNPDMKPTMVNNIRTMLTRANLTSQETRTYQGIISALIGNKTKD